MENELRAASAGTVKAVLVQAGQAVEKGAVLVELDTSVERAQLEAASASRDLASINLESGRSLVQSGAIPTSQWVALEAQAKQSAAEVARLNALIARFGFRWRRRRERNCRGLRAREQI